MGRPIIRHCKNCKYSNFELNRYNHSESIKCDVKFQHILEEFQRITAIFCPYYKRSDNNAKEKE